LIQKRQYQSRFQPASFIAVRIIHIPGISIHNARNPYSHPPGILIHIAPESVFTCPGIRSRDRNRTGCSYWSATPVLFPNFYNAVLTSGYRKDNISVIHNDRLRGSLVDFQGQSSCPLTGGDFGWPGCPDGKGQAIRG
jgi:hypothetical protein